MTQTPQLKKSPKSGKSSSTLYEGSSIPRTEPLSSVGYTPPPPPAAPPSFPEAKDSPSIPLPPPSAKAENPSSGKSRKTSSQPEGWEHPPSQRPSPHPVFGGAGLDSFLWSSLHDDDAEFLRRYGARVEIMRHLWGTSPEAAAAFARLGSLTL